MTPLETEGSIGLTVLISVAGPVLITGLLTLINKLVDIYSSRKKNKAEVAKAGAEATKTEADTSSVEADVFTKTLAGQGNAMDRILEENRRAYDRADKAETAAKASGEAAAAAQKDASLAREEVAQLRKDMEKFQRAQERFEEQIEGYLITRKIPLPDWWPGRHSADSGAE